MPLVSFMLKAKYYRHCTIHLRDKKWFLWCMCLFVFTSKRNFHVKFRRTMRYFLSQLGISFLSSIARAYHSINAQRMNNAQQYIHMTQNSTKQFLLFVIAAKFESCTLSTLSLCYISVRII